MMMALRAEVLISRHGTERVSCSGWSAELTGIVNDPARVSGMIGPLGPSAHFQYRGDLASFDYRKDRLAVFQNETSV
jgi:hypothetical protein